MKNIHRGSCLCGKIRYEVHGDIHDILNCHCLDCRKSHGAAFRTRGGVERDDFIFLSGENLLTRYEHKPEEFHCFCSKCGSRIITMFTDSSILLGLALGTLDTDLTKGPEFHIFTSDILGWNKITDNLPQYAEFPPSKNVAEQVAASDC